MEANFTIDPVAGGRGTFPGREEEEGKTNEGERLIEEMWYTLTF